MERRGRARKVGAEGLAPDVGLREAGTCRMPAGKVWPTHVPVGGQASSQSCQVSQFLPPRFPSLPVSQPLSSFLGLFFPSLRVFPAVFKLSQPSQSGCPRQMQSREVDAEETQTSSSCDRQAGARKRSRQAGAGAQIGRGSETRRTGRSGQ